jgi:hypothetical protein
LVVDERAGRVFVVGGSVSVLRLREIGRPRLITVTSPCSDRTTMQTSSITAMGVATPCPSTHVL